MVVEIGAALLGRVFRLGWKLDVVGNRRLREDSLRRPKTPLATRDLSTTHADSLCSSACFAQDDMASLSQSDNTSVATNS